MKKYERLIRMKQVPVSMRYDDIAESKEEPQDFPGISYFAFLRAISCGLVSDSKTQTISVVEKQFDKYSHRWCKMAIGRSSTIPWFTKNSKSSVCIPGALAKQKISPAFKISPHLYRAVKIESDTTT